MNKISIGFLGLGLLAMLAACAEREVILEGDRFGTRTPLDQAFPGIEAPEVAEDTAAPISLAEPVTLDSWPMRSLTTRNVVPHLSLSAAPVELWASDIGQGNTRRARITADPVMADGRIFTLDSDAQLTATGTDGSTLWTADLTAGYERGGGVSGGGLAVVGGVVYATTGYGELIALQPANGEVLWRQRLGAGITAPTVTDNSVYVVSRDSQAWSLNPENGRIRWQLPAGPATAVLSGGASPALTDRLVIFPFGSGELVATLRLSGVRVWGTTVAGARRGVAYNDLNDITGDPVIVGNTLYAGNQSGRVVAMEASSGERLWTAQDGAYSPVLPAGDSIFFVSDRNELIRLDAETGTRIWGTELPLYVNERERRRQAVFTHYGPILAGGRLVVASGDGNIRFFDPESGAELSRVEIRGGAAAHPIVVGGTLYVVSGAGRLHAFR
ncbi:PQQ-like beta-propeller repeat protein [Nioella sp. MMSF_3534]|jgi:outer membrane protein assembly factor BamB|uniref:PQQ-like beta-propeller repeat protein n=1 Tax=Nioella sp. MMSF_3534 TaxID=3046720 RepID=UPI00273FECF2|nr:PQQ-like beta-propeller repeat protein [Nioella sp. MMSF_3534]